MMKNIQVRVKKNYECSYGVMPIERHIYQNSKGGSTYCPLEEAARIFQNATPHFAKQVSSKYSEMSALQVQKDLADNHGRKISTDYLQKLSSRVGSLVESKKQAWTYCLPAKTATACLISFGRDGTTMPICSAGYRETMNGTISFYSPTGERLHTIYLAQAPEYGKAKFNAAFSQEIAVVKQLFPAATYIGLADGAKENWTYLDSHVEVSILDYWHACEYLSKASKAFSGSKTGQAVWAKKARKRLKNNKTGAKVLLREMKKQRKLGQFSKLAGEQLDKAITYFTNHQSQMKYSEYQEKDYPIGSGVTEAACKVIVKQRTNQSGMRWKIKNAQHVLNIRALNRTEGRWKQFWRKIDQWGIAA